MEKKKLLIFPCNGNGIEALDCIDTNEFDIIGFIDDSPEKQKKDYPFPVFSRDAIAQNEDAFIIAVPGSPLTFRKRSAHIDSLNISNKMFASIVHPRSSIGMNVSMGFNCLIMAGAVITSNAKIGNHVIVLPNTVIHHDAVVGDYSLIGSNVTIAGGAEVGQNCYIGSGSSIINGVRIGDFALVGLGSNVVSDIAAHSIVAGNPAKTNFRNQV